MTTTPGPLVHTAQLPHHSTLSLLAFFADIVYEVRRFSPRYEQRITYQLPEGWEIVANSANDPAMFKHNYCGMLLVNSGRKQAVFAHGGTDMMNGHDMSDGLKLFNHEMPAKYETMVSFVSATHHKIPEDHTICMTGHSAGGVLADLATLALYNLGDCRVKYSCAFDNPGAKHLASEVYGQELVDIAKNSTMFFTLQSRPNIFNTIGPQLGKKYLLFYSHRNDVEPRAVSYNYKLLPGNHGILWQVADMATKFPYSKLPDISWGMCKIGINGLCKLLDLAYLARIAMRNSSNTVLWENFFKCFFDLQEEAMQLISRVIHAGDHSLDEFTAALKCENPIMLPVDGGYYDKHTPLTVITSRDIVVYDSDDSMSLSSADTHDDSMTPTMWRTICDTPRKVWDSFSGGEYLQTPVLARSRSHGTSSPKTLGEVVRLMVEAGSIPMGLRDDTIVPVDMHHARDYAALDLARAGAGGGYGHNVRNEDLERIRDAVQVVQRCVEIITTASQAVEDTKGAVIDKLHNVEQSVKDAATHSLHAVEGYVAEMVSAHCPTMLASAGGWCMGKIGEMLNYGDLSEGIEY